MLLYYWSTWRGGVGAETGFVVKTNTDVTRGKLERMAASQHPKLANISKKQVHIRKIVQCEQSPGRQRDTKQWVLVIVVVIYWRKG